MESTIWFSVFSLLLLAATIVFLYLRAEKNLHRQSAESATLVQQAMELALTTAERHRSALESLVDRSENRQESLLEAVLQRMEARESLSMQSMELMQKSMDLTLTRALSGSQSLTTQVTTALQSSLALLGTSDTKAYREVMVGAAPLETSQEPYPGMDELEQEKLADSQRQKIQGLDQAISLLGSMGVNSGSTEA